MVTGNLRNIRIPDELWQAAKEAAEANGTTVSELVRELLAGYVEQNMN